ncbi:hypothetical protein LGK97_17400 [Clostridium sp. CS001]|uniref:hypothetical protein n=1 Tax=Clostridium sp. CS001 TaxID=2880648 RepID=UPI001CF5CC32|nr:hypothetical protein [Clostridium sp. CS001]MCB2291500.1 hypothetical protein [Clostridium sp. CS001]
MPSMPDLSKIKVSISNGFETISNKSEDFIETSKLKYKIHSEESSMDDLYKDIGKELYIMFKRNGHIDSSLLDYCNALKKIEKRISALEKEILNANNKR